MVLVYDEVRLVVYDYVEKEVNRKFKASNGLKIKDIILTEGKVIMLMVGDEGQQPGQSIWKMQLNL